MYFFAYLLVYFCSMTKTHKNESGGGVARCVFPDTRVTLIVTINLGQEKQRKKNVTKFFWKKNEKEKGGPSGEEDFLL